jgi:phosphatidylglycerol:prolipoprotein diacylglycerol transferase
MMPVAFRIPFLELDVPGYGLALTIGFLLSVAWAVRRATRSGANPDVVLNCAFIALIGGVVGARAMYVVHYPEQVIPANAGAVQTVLAVVNVRQGGLEVYGGCCWRR